MKKILLAAVACVLVVPAFAAQDVDDQGRDEERRQWKNSYEGKNGRRQWLQERAERDKKIRAQELKQKRAKAGKPVMPGYVGPKGDDKRGGDRPQMGKEMDTLVDVISKKADLKNNPDVQNLVTINEKMRAFRKEREERGQGRRGWAHRGKGPEKDEKGEGKRAQHKALFNDLGAAIEKVGLAFPNDADVQALVKRHQKMLEMKKRMMAERGKIKNWRENHPENEDVDGSEIMID